MNQFQSGLLLEAIEEAEKGIKTEERRFSGGKVTRVTLKKNNPYHRPAGQYTTVELSQVQHLQDDSLEEAVRQISEVLLHYVVGERVLVAALGNNDITPDSLGPKMLSHLMITRPYEKIEPGRLGKGRLRSVAAVCTNVYGATGVESAEMICGICRQIAPDCVVVIDALATTHLSRLCSTVQISDTGITPGGGVGNARLAVDEKTLGVPVISVGMPTVMNGQTLAGFLTEDEGKIRRTLSPFEQDLIVTPTQIGWATDNGAKLIAFSLNRALHYRMSIPDMLKYLS
ncbi:MAG: GPR endopeptidase [Clostridia bacterium]|nr:GPR endopeptidase [Clostridia bacterium]